VTARTGDKDAGAGVFVHEIYRRLSRLMEAKEEFRVAQRTLKQCPKTFTNGEKDEAIVSESKGFILLFSSYHQCPIE